MVTPDQVVNWFKGAETPSPLEAFIETTSKRGIVNIARPRWLKYGLEIWDYKHRSTPDEIFIAILRHDLVSNYLDSHVEAREQYSADQNGKLSYYDILRLAENEFKGESEAMNCETDDM